MERLRGAVKDYAWGSTTAIPSLFDVAESDTPVAELWLGTHEAGSAVLGGGLAYSPDASPGEIDLRSYVRDNPEGALGADVARMGNTLPYLLKLIAPAKPLSLQVHPSREQAARRFEDEERAGVPLSDPTRSYRDRNHKPELLLALDRFEAVAGFRAPRRVADVITGLPCEIADTMLSYLREDLSSVGMRRCFEYLLSDETRPSPEKVADLVYGCRVRLDSGDSPSVRADRIVTLLAGHYPGDPGVVASLLLNPVTLHPGEALFVPAGTVHAYLSGLGVEIMANSDNVLRAGLTSKHIDVPELLATVDYVAAPPIRIAPEYVSDVTRTYYAPVEDFELSVIELRTWNEVRTVPGGGPRILLALAGAIEVATKEQRITLNRGEGVFVRADEGKLEVCGVGTLIQADVP
ncbi:mannose-6-phosphate isomerase, class I [Flaviflexus huanghaiensis]|uniref:mannose-6-phosphate isomerase, class I n=1 Tax=Flaviflexus huanghaiensis TaxID=1111473 RepID=UPI0015F9FF4D